MCCDDIGDETDDYTSDDTGDDTGYISGHLSSGDTGDNTSGHIKGMGKRPGNVLTGRQNCSKPCTSDRHWNHVTLTQALIRKN